MIREGDIVDAPRLNKTHQEEGEDGKKVKKVKLDKVKTTDQTDSDGDIIWFVQETGDTLEKEKVKRVTGDAFDNEDTGENEDDDGESIEDKDVEGVSDNEIKNSSEEEAGFKDTSENAFDDEDTDEKPDEDDENDDKTCTTSLVWPRGTMPWTTRPRSVWTLSSRGTSSRTPRR